MQGTHCAVLTFLLTLLRVAAPRSTVNVQKEIVVKEEIPVDSFVAGIPELLHLVSGQSTFKLISQKLLHAKNGEERQCFSVDESSGAVTVRQRLDRETLCAELKHCVVLLQVFVRRKAKILNLKIIIDDVNDNSPLFPVNSIALNVSEAMSVGESVSLDSYIPHDADLGNNSALSYTLNQNKFFRIYQFKDEMETNHLRLEIVGKLDFETQAVHYLTVTARDGGLPSRSNVASLRITVHDVNDNRPVFDSQEYKEELRENLPPGHVISHVHATDVDTGLWGSVHYSVSKRNKDAARKLVRIDEVTGDVILRQKLDRERHDGLRIRIEARDEAPANEQLVGGTWLLIKVKDVNDNRPTISVNFIGLSDGHTVYVSENSTVDTYFAYVSTNDEDVGRNGQVNVRLKSITPSGSAANPLKTFILSDGLLGVAGTLDREIVNHYTVVLKACDQGETQQCSEKTIEIEILDVNDHSPIFHECETKMTVSEDMRVGSVLTRVHATDDDSLMQPALAEKLRVIGKSSNGDFRYSIANGDGTFSINPQSGQINLVRPLDREAKDHFKVSVVAQDKGWPTPRSTSCHISLKIDDVNDCAPTFVNPPSEDYKVHATILRNDLIIRIQAIDNDLGRKGVVRYSILGVDSPAGSEDKKAEVPVFILDSISGELRLNLSSPDPEKLLGEHKLFVEARDQGVQPMKNIRRLTVIVTDREVLPGDETTKHVIIVVSLALALFLITLIIVVAYWKYRNNRKKSRTYSCAKRSEEKEWGRSTLNSSKQQSFESKPSPSKENKEIEEGMHWDRSWNSRRANSIHSTSGDGITSSPETEASSKTMNLHRQPSIQSGSSVCSKNILGNPLSTHRNLSHDGDSGRGDSDPDCVNYDLTYERELKKFHSNLAASRHSPSHSPYFNNQLGPHCNQSCLRYGHSDSCWMPSSGQDPIPYVGSKSSLYVQLRPLPAREELRPLVPPRNVPRLLSPRPSEDNSLQAIPESVPLRRMLYPVSDLSSIYSNVVSPHRYFPVHFYGEQRHFSPVRRISDVNAHHAVPFNAKPAGSRTSPRSIASSPQHSDCGLQRRSHCVDRRDVAPDDAAATSTVSAPATPRKPAQVVTRSSSADHLTSSNAFHFSHPDAKGQTTADEHANAPSSETISMRETQKIVDNIEKLLQS